MSRALIALFGMLAAAGTSGRASAADATESASNRSPSGDTRAARHWYGYQILILDALAVTAVLVDEAADWGGAAAIPAGFLYVVGPPSMHSLGHDREGAALGSLVLRLSLPIGGAVGAAVSCDGDECVANAGTGLVLGAALATLIDAGILGWKDVKVRPTASISRTGVFGAATFSF
jgi:hypothetical protein